MERTETSEASEQPSQAGGAKDGTVRILVIEDNPADARLIQECFRDDATSLPVTVTTVASLREAFDALDEGKEDFILLDLSLPDSTGLDTFIAIQEKAPALPIVVLSGNENEELAAEIVKSGAQDSLSKDLLGLELSAALLRRTVRHAIERKQAHEALKMMQMQLIQAEKMESLGRLAAGVAHEVRNPLACVQLGLEYLRDGIEPDDPNVENVLERMSTGMDRATAILREMLDFAGDRGLEFEAVDPRQLLKRALLLVEHEVKIRKITVVREFQSGETIVKVDPAKIEQVLINLILNGAHAMEESEVRTLVLRTSVETIEGLERNPGARTRDHLRNGDKVVVIEIEDSGGGIAEEDLEKVWDPFFTTKPTGAGTGLGLSVVKKIVDLHYGSIELVGRESGVIARLKLKAD